MSESKYFTVQLQEIPENHCAVVINVEAWDKFSLGERSLLPIATTCITFDLKNYRTVLRTVLNSPSFP